jgi:hypothetical protein
MRVTKKRPFVCWHCDWIGWVVPEAGAHHPPGDEGQRPGGPPSSTPADDGAAGPHFFASVPAEPDTPAVAGLPKPR